MLSKNQSKFKQMQMDDIKEAYEFILKELESLSKTFAEEILEYDDENSISFTVLDQDLDWDVLEQIRKAVQRREWELVGQNEVSFIDYQIMPPSFFFGEYRYSNQRSEYENCEKMDVVNMMLDESDWGLKVLSLSMRSLLFSKMTAKMKQVFRDMAPSTTTLNYLKDDASTNVSLIRQKLISLKDFQRVFIMECHNERLQHLLDQIKLKTESETRYEESQIMILNHIDDRTDRDLFIEYSKRIGVQYFDGETDYFHYRPALPMFMKPFTRMNNHVEF